MEDGERGEMGPLRNSQANGDGIILRELDVFRFVRSIQSDVP